MDYSLALWLHKNVKQKTATAHEWRLQVVCDNKKRLIADTAESKIQQTTNGVKIPVGSIYSKPFHRSINHNYSRTFHSSAALKKIQPERRLGG
jgi:hypothetical protein